MLDKIQTERAQLSKKSLRMADSANRVNRLMPEGSQFLADFRVAQIVGETGDQPHGELALLCFAIGNHEIHRFQP